MRVLRSRGWVVGVCVAMVALGGSCQKRGLAPGDATAVAGLGEEGLAGSSLSRARRGLSPEEDGILRDVRFTYDSYDIDAAGRAALAENLQWLRDNRDAKVELEGHCDSRGTIEYNLALGAKRARSVKDHLLADGMDPARISTISYGEELPLCHDETKACWARNRRVHFVVLGQ